MERLADPNSYHSDSPLQALFEAKDNFEGEGELPDPDDYNIDDDSSGNVRNPNHYHSSYLIHSSIRVMINRTTTATTQRIRRILMILISLGLKGMLNQRE